MLIPSRSNIVDQICDPTVDELPRIRRTRLRQSAHLGHLDLKLLVAGNQIEVAWNIGINGMGICQEPRTGVRVHVGAGDAILHVSRNRESRIRLSEFIELGVSCNNAPEKHAGTIRLRAHVDDQNFLIWMGACVFARNLEAQIALPDAPFVVP